MRRETFSVGDAAEIEVSASSGSVTLESGPPGKVEVEIDTRDPDAWQVRQSGNSIWVAYERGLIDRGGRARVRISMPEGSSLNAHTASASLRAGVTLGRTTVATASGDVALGDCGTASVKTASGDIEVGAVHTDLAARSASGDVRVRSVGGGANVTTMSGDILIDRIEGDLAVSTASGDLRVPRYLGEDLEASTISGDLTLGLPSGRRVRLQAKTLSGSVRLPERKQSPESAGPEVSIRLKSVSGDIRISRIG